MRKCNSQNATQVSVLSKQAQKPPPNEFKFITPKNPLINNQAITSMRNLTTTLAYPNIPTYHGTFASMPNWSWYCSSLLSFVAKISNLWLTTKTWMIVVGRKIFHFINNEDQEALNYKTLKCTNAVASHRVYEF